MILENQANIVDKNVLEKLPEMRIRFKKALKEAEKNENKGISLENSTRILRIKEDDLMTV